MIRTNISLTASYPNIHVFAQVDKCSACSPARTQSSNSHLIFSPRLKINIGFRFFSVAAPTRSKSLSDNVMPANTVMTFHCHLKTYLINLTYSLVPQRIHLSSDSLESLTNMTLANGFVLMHH